MRSNHRSARMIALLSLVLVASALSFPTSAQAGPISDMLARHRQNKQMKLPAMDPPFSKKPIKDLNVQTASFSSRLKKRFTFQKVPTSGVIPFRDMDKNAMSR